MRWIALAAALAASGCGYTWGAVATQERTASGSLPRVAVLPFDNDTFRRGLEMRLTRMVADELRARSPQAAVRPGEADWLLGGRITEAGEQVLSEDRGDAVRESSFVVTAEVQIRERATERVIRTYSMTEREPFSDRAGRIATLESAQEQALRDLAERIVYVLEAGSPGSPAAGS
ncbi:MAG: LptE family protein [Planctomycetaceae bacterium]